MYLLYLDESGSQDSQHFVVGGLAVHEQDAPDIAEAVNSILRTFSPLFEHEELHTQHIRAGKGPWRRIPRPEREQLLDEIASFLVSGSWGLGRKIRMFAVVMHKESFPRLDPHERAYEEFFARGNAMLGRMTFSGEPHRCLAIADKSRLEMTLQQLMKGWRTQGGSTGGQIRPMVGYAEVPVFVESSASRLVQLADFVAHWVFRAYEFEDTRRLVQLTPGFDTDGQVMYGLVHLVRGYRECDCAACSSRR